MCVCLSVCVCVSLSVCLPVCLSVCLSARALMGEEQSMKEEFNKLKKDMRCTVM